MPTQLQGCFYHHLPESTTTQQLLQYIAHKLKLAVLLNMSAWSLVNAIHSCCYSVQSSLTETLTLAIGIKIAPGTYYLVFGSWVCMRSSTHNPAPSQLSLPRAKLSLMIWTSSRDPTFSGDKVIAVAGIVSVLAPKLGSLVRYLAGLWERGYALDFVITELL